MFLFLWDFRPVLKFLVVVTDIKTRTSDIPKIVHNLRLIHL